MKRYFQILSFVLMTGFIACKNPQKDQTISISSDDSSRYIPQNYVELIHPEWSKNATIYEVNIRQFTPEGNFKAFESSARH